MERIFRVLIVVAIIGLGIASVQVRSKCIELEASIGRARLQKKALLNEQKLLTAKREELLSLQRLRYVAMAKLGLHETDRKKVLFIVEKKTKRGPLQVRYEKKEEGVD